LYPAFTPYSPPHQFFATMFYNFGVPMPPMQQDLDQSLSLTLLSQSFGYPNMATSQPFTSPPSLLSTQDISTQLDQQVSMEEFAQGHCCLAEQWETLVNGTQNIPC